MYDVLLRTTLEGQIQGKKVCGTLVNCCAMNTQVTVVTCLDNCEPQRCGVNQYSVQFEMMSPPNQPLTGHISVTDNATLATLVMNIKSPVARKLSHSLQCKEAVLICISRRS